MAMQRIPLHTEEKLVFTPVAFAEMEKPPTFTLKTPSRRQREEMQYAIHEAGLRRHDDETIREATIEELCRLWNCDEEGENVVRFKQFWQAVDEYNDGAEQFLIEAAAAVEAGEEAPPKFPPFEYADQPAIDELMERLAQSSDRLRRLTTQNVRFAKEFPRYVLAHALSGWTELETAPRFEGGVMSLDAVCDLQEELDERFGALGDTAFIELSGQAINRFFLTKGAEKNSASGLASQQTPPDSKGTGSASKSGNSPASVSSDETPAD